GPEHRHTTQNHNRKGKRQMRTIRTKFHGPTNARGARISARDTDGNRVSIPYPHDAKRGEGAHSRAALELCHKMGWKGQLIGGALDSSGFVFVFQDERDTYDADE